MIFNRLNINGGGIDMSNENNKVFELTIKVNSNDGNFKNDGNYGYKTHEPVDIYYLKSDSEVVRRNLAKNEQKNTIKTMPRLAYQVFENELNTLSDEERLNFQIGKSKTNVIEYGLYKEEELESHGIRAMDCVALPSDNDKKFYIHASWNLFCSIFFVQECLKRWGKTDDKFVLIYREKNKDDDKNEISEENIENETSSNQEYLNKYSKTLLSSKNLIFRGAPGTGKSYLAHEVAADIVSNGETDKYEELDDGQKKRVRFVQFHPSYDYSDFVEGLRPVLKDGVMGFERKDGVFMEFVEKAKKI